jgi:hypothetical protein
MVGTLRSSANIKDFYGWHPFEEEQLKCRYFGLKNTAVRPIPYFFNTAFFSSASTIATAKN